MTLEDEGLDDNTLVVFTSDNGPWHIFKTHGETAGLLQGAKRGTLEGGFRVPANFRLPGYKGKVKYAQFLHDASEINITAPYGHHMQGSIATENDLNLRLPVNKPNVEIPVIEVFLK